MSNNDSLPQQQQQQPKQEWTMKPSEMTDWMEQVSSQALLQLHRFANLESATSLVLEVGAGRGTYSVGALQVMPPSAKLLLTDASTEMVAELQKLLVENNDPRLAVQHVNAVELPLATASVDSYLANLVLHHMSDPAVGLREAWRVLKPGGRLCLTEVDAGASGSLFQIPRQAMELAGVKKKEQGGRSGHSHEHHHHHHHHEHHAHGHEHAAAAADTKSKNDDESKQHQNDKPQQGHNQHHNHQHATRHGGVEDVQKMVREAGFVSVVAWHFDCIAETVDATRFAKYTFERLCSKGEMGDDDDDETRQRVQTELTRLAQIELDAGRPISFGTVILTANKPSLE